MAQIRELIPAALPTPITVLTLIAVAILLSACGEAPASPTTTAVPTEVISPDTGMGEGDIAGVVEDVAEAVAERTPVPTSTPGPVARAINQQAEIAGLGGRTFLGLTVLDWIDLGLAITVVVLGYLFSVRLLYGVLRGIVRRAPTPFDGAFLDTIQKEFRWLVAVLLTRYAITHLGFINDRLRTILDDAIFLLGLVVVTRIAFKLIHFSGQWYRDHLEPDKDRERLDAMVLMIQRVAGGLVLVLGGSIGLNHFGINIPVILALLLVIVLVIAIVSRGIVSDIFGGFLILIDQPFRVGDAVWIEALDTWGEVMDIGMRRTHIRTRDNGVVIVPNGKVIEGRVTNYSYPEPSYRAQIDIGVEYGAEFDEVRRIIQGALREVEGVLPDKPVDVLFVNFGEYARVVQVRWWVESMQHNKRVLDRVNIAI
jgi:small-conductance mechanosensitive channel